MDNSQADASAHLDPEYLPFSEAEVRHALILISSEADATAGAAEIAAIHAWAAERTRDAELARSRGSQDPEEIASPSLDIGDDLLALLRCVPAFAARVDDVMERRWSEWSRGWTRSEMMVRGIPAEDDPPAEVVQQVRRKLAPYRGAWTRRKRRVAASLDVPPKGTAT